eukprot:gene8394-10310_t
MQSPKMFDLMVTFGSLYLIQKIDFTKPDNVLYAQFAFGAVQIITLGVYFMIYRFINANPNKTMITVPPAMGARQDAQPERKTVSEYDYSQLKKSVGQMIFSVVITAVLFFKMGIIQPIAMQTILGPQNLYKNKLFKIYILNEHDKHPRPWVEESPFNFLGGASTAGQPKDEKESEDNDSDIIVKKDDNSEDSSEEEVVVDKKNKKKKKVN